VLGGGLLVVMGVALVVSGERRPRAAEVEQAQPTPVPEPARSS
jgi:hypothetical protein